MPNALQQGNYDALSQIDPMVLWGRQHQIANPGQFGTDFGAGKGYGHQEQATVESMLPPRIMNEVKAGRMTLQAGLMRYLEFLKKQGAGGPPAPAV